jgi:hypothetical protein
VTVVAAAMYEKTDTVSARLHSVSMTLNGRTQCLISNTVSAYLYIIPNNRPKHVPLQVADIEVFIRWV